MVLVFSTSAFDRATHRRGFMLFKRPAVIFRLASRKRVLLAGGLNAISDNSHGINRRVRWGTTTGTRSGIGIATPPRGPRMSSRFIGQLAVRMRAAVLAATHTCHHTGNPSAMPAHPRHGCRTPLDTPHPRSAARKRRGLLQSGHGLQTRPSPARPPAPSSPIGGRGPSPRGKVRGLGPSQRRRPVTKLPRTRSQAPRPFFPRFVSFDSLVRRRRSERAASRRGHCVDANRK